VKDVVHSVVLVFLFLFVVYNKKRKFQILETITNDKKNASYEDFCFTETSKDFTRPASST
jgi:hypothetical protein